MEIIQRLKREGVKNVNMLAAVILPNRTEAATQRIRTQPEYKQDEQRIRQRKLLPQRVLEMPKRTTVSETLTPKSINSCTNSCST